MGCEISKNINTIQPVTHIYTEHAIEYQPFNNAEGLKITMSKKELQIGEHFTYDEILKNKSFNSEYNQNQQCFNKQLQKVEFKQMWSREDSMRIFIKDHPHKFFDAGVNIGFPYEYRWWAQKAILKVHKPPTNVIAKMIEDHEGIKNNELNVDLDKNLQNQIYSSRKFFTTKIFDVYVGKDLMENIIKCLKLYFPKLWFNNNFLWVISYVIQLSGSSFIHTFFIIRKMLTDKKFLFFKFYSQPDCKYVEKEQIQSKKGLDKFQSSLTGVLTIMVLKIVHKSSKKLYSHLFTNSSSTNTDTKPQSTPDTFSVDQIEFVNLQVLLPIIEWIESQFTINFPGNYCLRLWDIIFTQDVFSLVYIVSSILLSLEKVLLKMNPETNEITNMFLKMELVDLPSFKTLVKKYKTLILKEEVLKEMLDTIYFELKENKKITDLNDQKVVISHLKALLIYKQLFVEDNSFYRIEPAKHRDMIESKYEETMMTNFSIDKNYFEKNLDDSMIESGVSLKDDWESILEFEDNFKAPLSPWNPNTTNKTNYTEPNVQDKSSPVAKQENLKEAPVVSTKTVENNLAKEEPVIEEKPVENNEVKEEPVVEEKPVEKIEVKEEPVIIEEKPAENIEVKEEPVIVEEKPVENNEEPVIEEKPAENVEQPTD